METEIFVVGEEKGAKLGELSYGTIVTGAPNNPASFYIKVDKRDKCAGVSITCPKGHSLLLNLKSGTVRAVPGDSRVTILKAKIECVKVPTDNIYTYNKGY